MLYSEIAHALDGRLFGEDRVLKSASIDSRTIGQGDLFIALKGDHFDGHDFVCDVMDKGAAGAMVQKKTKATLPQIVVPDTRLGLGGLARQWRNQYAVQAIAITGSNGKTTVKEMLASILRQKGETLVTQGNLNNDIGVPLTLLRLNATHRYAVIEMGANHPGEIRYLSSLVSPRAAVITNAGPAHLEGFGSVEGVARAKAEIYEHLQDDGTAIINMDDVFFPAWKEKTVQYQQIGFSLENPAADVYGQWSNESNRLMINIRGNTCEVLLPLPGKHNARNALAATAAALSIDVDLSAIKAGLESVQPVKGRLLTRRGIAGIRILDDTYNANPASVLAALDVVSQMPGEAWFVLGDMGELGMESGRLHTWIGELAAATGIHRLFTLGKLSLNAATAFGEGAQSYDSVEPLVNAVKADLHSSVNLLVKGSRAMRMEEVVAQLIDNSVAERGVK